MTASEFAFLAIGLVLGVASGAALIEVLRARPPSAREVRVTVAPNAIQSRLSSTLSEPLGHGAGFPAAGGPGDRRWRDEVVASGEPATTGRRVEDHGRRSAGRSKAPSSGTPVLAVVGAGPRLVPVPMSSEPDPMTAALRAVPVPVAAGAAPPADAPGSEPMSASAPAMRGGSAMAVPPAAAAEPATGDGGAPEASADVVPARAPAPAGSGPCAEERRVADERCEVATRARERADAAAETLRRAQRTYDDLVSRAETAAATADPRAVRTAKEQAQQRFRTARSRAGTRDDVEAGARTWLAEINQINHDTREAALSADRDRAAAASLGPQVERLTVEADAARITAERADEACMSAREAVAQCDEARALEAAAARSATPAAGAELPAPDAAEVAESDERPARIAAAMPEPEDEFAFSTPMNSQGTGEAVILRILRGDREAMQRAVARLAGDDPEASRLWQAQLGAFADALIARSIDAVAFEFPIDHFFWGPFTQSQSRDIAAGLSSLGYRFDGFGDWVDEHVPSQRDLSLAVGYAGLDPMRIRRWPTEPEMQELLREVRVAADEYLAGAAGGMTLGELVSMLGRRADGLAELWNQWGQVRPILLEAS